MKRKKIQHNKFLYVVYLLGVALFMLGYDYMKSKSVEWFIADLIFVFLGLIYIRTLSLIEKKIRKK